LKDFEKSLKLKRRPVKIKTIRGKKIKITDSIKEIKELVLRIPL